MPQATNLISNDDSMQAEALGTACLVSIIGTINILLIVLDQTIRYNKKWRRSSTKHIPRKRRTLHSLKLEYGYLFQRAYRMDYTAFHHLHELLKNGISEYIRKDQVRHSNGGKCFHYCNGEITMELRLACALRFFAGGSYLDITISHGIGKTDVYRSVWAVVHATNSCKQLEFHFPMTQEQCKQVAQGFAPRSKAGFNNCIGCIDGMLLWTEKPNASECQKVGVDSGKFFCGRKGKFGLNLLRVCDSMRRFTYISIQHPASSSDYLAFVTSSLYVQFTEGEGLPKGFCLYGDNAYVNDTYMAVPFPNTSNGPRDSYNYYHSQVRINIECSFGVLTNRLRILKSPLSSHIPIHRINALVLCLCKLHNFVSTMEMRVLQNVMSTTG